jgi:hypothetical protein
MKYVAACLGILSSLALIAPADARWIDVTGVTNDGATLSFENNDLGRTRFKYRVITNYETRFVEGVTNWCYRGKVKLNPNAVPTTSTPGWYVYKEDGYNTSITPVYANSPASMNLLEIICAAQ